MKEIPTQVVEGARNAREVRSACFKSPQTALPKTADIVFQQDPEESRFLTFNII